MDELLHKMSAEMNKAARELGLEATKTIKLESSTQLGHYLRITRKVCVWSDLCWEFQLKVM